MSELHSDALVFFGATRDLEYNRTFLSLQAMVKRAHLNVHVLPQDSWQNPTATGEL
jgi:glucose-6-phosphate 1-dehydrogenase